MGKATGLSSQFRGKVGNVVGYLTKNRAGRYEQTVKGYQPVVANPQSYAQALARVPVGPVQRVCSALLPLIQRGFEGTAYGDPSKNEFLSYNLKYFRGPYMPKGSVIVPPGPMLISKGSLRTVTVDVLDKDSDGPYIAFSLYGNGTFHGSTIGDLARVLLDNTPWLASGEQLTFCWCILSGGQYIWGYFSMLLNVNDTRPLPSGDMSLDIYDDQLYISFDFGDEPADICAAGCIRSQPYGESSFKRSTCILKCNPLVELYNDDAAVNAAVASYRTGEDPEDWEDDPTPEYQQLAYLMMVNITADMVMSDTTPPIAGKQCLGYVTKGGETGIFYMYSNTHNANCLIDGQAQILMGTGPSGEIPYLYKASYEPAREYSSIYGHM